MRRFTLLGRWKFRELNELPHLLDQRLNRAYIPSYNYLNQFPSEVSNIVARLISFVLGSITGVLVTLSLLLPDALLYLEITEDRTLLFYLSVLASILAITRSMRSPDALVHEPEVLMRDVIAHTHYCPTRWLSRLHSLEVKNEFSQLFTLRLIQYVHELLSVICTPLVLGFSLPAKSTDIVNFLIDRSVFVPGLGFVYEDSLFNPNAPEEVLSEIGQPHEPLSPSSSVSLQDNLNNAKLAKSIMYFKVRKLLCYNFFFFNP